MLELAELVKKCQAERLAFRQRQERASPHCIELFRRAFAQDRQAWESIFAHVFQEEIQGFLTAALRQKGDSFRFQFQPEDVADAQQETRLAFWRYAAKRPTLLQSGELGPLIEYLKLCAKSAVATIARKLPPRQEESLTNLAGEDSDDSADSTAQVRKFQPLLPSSPAAQHEWLAELVEELRKLLTSEEECIVAQECFLNETPPRELVEDYPHLFAGESREAKIKQVNNTLQRIRRRTLQAPYFQNLRSARQKSAGAAFLSFSALDGNELTTAAAGEATMTGSERCPIDEADLLEYVRGVASAATRLAIERSPVCVAAAQELAAHIAALTPMLRLALCPDVDTLLDYHEKRLRGAQQLVIHRHVQGCRQCQAEVAMFAAIDEVPVQEAPSLLRQIIEAVLFMPTAALSPVRGTILQYQTPTIYILLDTRKAVGKTRTWSLYGELRTHDGLPFADLERVSLQRMEAENAPAMPATIEEAGAFVIKGVEAGDHRLQIITSTEEILIRRLTIGGDG